MTILIFLNFVKYRNWNFNGIQTIVRIRFVTKASSIYGQRLLLMSTAKHS